MNYRFTNEFAPAALDEVVEYALGPRLWIPADDYPDSDSWAQKAHRELKQGAKRAVVAFDHANVVGAIIYQAHKTEPGVLEVKRLTVRPDQRGRYLASFLLRNTELQGAADYDARAVLLDSKVTNTGIRNFLLRHHYKIVDQRDLYGLGAGEDYVYRKTLVAKR